MDTKTHFESLRRRLGVLPKHVNSEFEEKCGSWLWCKMSTITVTWLCLSNRKSEHTWSHFFLFADFNGSPCCLHFGVNHLVEAHSATTESFNISAMTESKMLHPNLSSMDFPWIRVCPLLFPENTIDKSCNGMWPHAFTFFVWQTKHCDQIIDVCHRRQPLCLSLNSWSTCFGSKNVCTRTLSIYYRSYFRESCNLHTVQSSV